MTAIPKPFLAGRARKVLLAGSVVLVLAILIRYVRLPCEEDDTPDKPLITRSACHRARERFERVFFNASTSYNEKLAWLREHAFPQLQEQGLQQQPATYLDFTGSGLYNFLQLEMLICDLHQNLYGNSHSQSPSSVATEAAVSAVRHQILKFFSANPSDYTVVFTSGCTGALKLVGDTFHFTAPKAAEPLDQGKQSSTNGSRFIYLLQNHNSVLGIRELAMEKGVTYEVKSPSEVEEFLLDYELSEPEGRRPPIPSVTAGASNSAGAGNGQNSASPGPFHLFAYPAEENFAGVKFPLEWINRFHAISPHWKVLLDAAAFVPTSPLNLTQYPADFVTLSFYKMIGYPTGLGALILRNDAVSALGKRYFGGGTVSVACGRLHYQNFHVCPYQKYEDGTVNFLNILALQYGLRVLEGLGMPRIQAHTERMRARLVEQILSLRHLNGVALVEIFGEHDSATPSAKQQGPIVNFLLHDAHGDIIGYNKVVQIAAENGIHLRAGTHCNPGAAFDYLDIDESKFVSYAEKHKLVCGGETEFWDDSDSSLAPAAAGPSESSSTTTTTTTTTTTSSSSSSATSTRSNGRRANRNNKKKPFGSLRVSLGYPTTQDDIDRFAFFLESHFLQ